MQTFYSLIVALYLLTFPVQVLAAPTPPTLSHATHESNLIVSWSEVDDATSYTLYYAPYPYMGPETIGDIEMGAETSFSIHLWHGATYYIAVTAKNSSGESDFSNINIFTIRIPVTLTGLTISGDEQVYEEETLQLTATASWSDGTTTDVTEQATWSEDSSAVVSVSDGLVVAAKVSSDKQATIHASYTDKAVTFDDEHLISVEEAPPLTDNGNGTVTDNTTGLVWQQSDDDISRSWQLAVSYCEDLTLGRSSNWRLPSGEELYSLVVPNQQPTINNIYFRGTNAANYWSSTSEAHLLNYAWNVNFKNARAYNYYKTNYYYVRCVR